MKKTAFPKRSTDGSAIDTIDSARPDTLKSISFNNRTYSFNIAYLRYLTFSHGKEIVYMCAQKRLYLIGYS